MTMVGRMVQYRLSAATAARFNAVPGVVRRYAAGDLLPAVVLSTRPTERCDLQVFLHGAASGYVEDVRSHYAAEGCWVPVPGR